MRGFIEVGGNSHGRYKTFWCSIRCHNLRVGAKDLTNYLVAGSCRNVSQDSCRISGMCSMDRLA